MRALVLAVLCAGCAHAPAHVTPPAAVEKWGCPAVVDVPALLARHASTFGTEAQVTSALPWVLRYDLEVQGKPGDAELTLAAHGHRWTSTVAGLRSASGIDEQGAWAMSTAGGVVARLLREEALDTAFDGWVARRAYLSAFDPKRDRVACIEKDGAARVQLRIEELAVGLPQLELDLATAALTEALSVTPSGVSHVTTYDTWGAKDEHGVRWPTLTHVIDAYGNRDVQKLQRSSAAECGETCVAIPPQRVEVTWPKSGRVRMPMKHYLGELSIRVKTQGREVWALLDSGAGTTVVDATMPAAQTFVPNLQVTGAGATEEVHAGLGELAEVRLSDLVLRHLPAASIPIPALDGYGDRRPEIIVGFPIFLVAAVRIDYARGELVLARTADGLVTKQAIALPLFDFEDKPITEALVDGNAARFLVDTGDAAGVDFYKMWTDTHGLPGSRPTAAFRGKTGAGTDASDSTLFRLSQFQLGPIRHDDRLSMIDDPPQAGVMAGFFGNDVLSHCAAVVFDVPQRKLWLEPPCDRPRIESLAAWRLVKQPAVPAHPWVIESVTKSGSTADAGLQPGDRVLSVDGIDAALDVSKIQSRFERPVGTKVTVMVQRGTSRTRIVVPLHRLLDDGETPTP